MKVYGSVQDKMTKKALRGVELLLEIEDKDQGDPVEWAVLHSIESGNFENEDSRDYRGKTLRCKAEIEGYTTHESTYPIKGDEIEINLTLEAGKFEVRFEINNEKGEPLKGAKLTLKIGKEALTSGKSSDKSGLIKIPVAADHKKKKASYQVDHKGFETVQGKCELRDGSPKKIILIEKTIRIEIKVKDKEGNPLQGVKISLRMEHDDIGVYSTDPSGLSQVVLSETYQDKNVDYVIDHKNYKLEQGHIQCNEGSKSEISLTKIPSKFKEILFAIGLLILLLILLIFLSKSQKNASNRSSGNIDPNTSTEQTEFHNAAGGHDDQNANQNTNTWQPHKKKKNGFLASLMGKNKTRPTIHKFYLDPSVVQFGTRTKAKLKWEVQNADTITITSPKRNETKVEAKGEITIEPLVEARTYTLISKNKYGRNTEKIPVYASFSNGFNSSLVPADILFGTGESALSKEMQKIVLENAHIIKKAIKSNPRTIVYLEGYSDHPVRSKKFSSNLAELRANVVKYKLIKEGKIAKEYLVIQKRDSKKVSDKLIKRVVFDISLK